MIDRTLDWIERHMLAAILITIAALVLLIASVLASVANAATLTGSYTLPTSYEDGTVLSPGQIRHIRVEAGTCTGSVDQPTFGTKEGEQLVAPPATSFSITIPRAFGDFCVRAYTVTLSGTESAPVCCAKKSIVEPKPNPPRLLTISTVAYELREYAGGTLRFVQVGTVPRGAPCGLALTRTYAAFPDAVLTKPTAGGIIAAKCSPES